MAVAGAAGEEIYSVAPSGIYGGDTYSAANDTKFSTEEDFYRYHLNEVCLKFKSVPNDVWAKLICMERNQRVAKAYINVPVMTIDGSFDIAADKLGLSRFGSHRTSQIDAQIVNIKRRVRQGIKLKLDKDGSILAKSMCEDVTIYVRSVKNQLLGVLPHKKAIRLFDIAKFKSALESSFASGSPVEDLFRLHCLATITLCLSENTEHLLACPVWLLLVNMCAVDILQDHGFLPPAPAPPAPHMAVTPSHHLPPQHLPPHHLPSHHLPSHHLPSHHMQSHHFPPQYLPPHHLPPHHLPPHHLSSPNLSSPQQFTTPTMSNVYETRGRDQLPPAAPPPGSGGRRESVWSVSDDIPPVPRTALRPLPVNTQHVGGWGGMAATGRRFSLDDLLKPVATTTPHSDLLPPPSPAGAAAMYKRHSLADAFRPMDTSDNLWMQRTKSIGEDIYSSEHYQSQEAVTPISTPTMAATVAAPTPSEPDPGEERSRRYSLASAFPELEMKLKQVELSRRHKLPQAASGQPPLPPPPPVPPPPPSTPIAGATITKEGVKAFMKAQQLQPQSGQFSHLKQRAQPQPVRLTITPATATACHDQIAIDDSPADHTSSPHRRHSTPNIPAKPNYPGKPPTPLLPAKPGYFSRPSSPNAPIKPDWSGRPSSPNAPIKPDMSGRPSSPNAPIKPNFSGRPSSPNAPIKPDTSGRPRSPNNQEKPEGDFTKSQASPNVLRKPEQSARRCSPDIMAKLENVLGGYRCNPSISTKQEFVGRPDSPHLSPICPPVGTPGITAMLTVSQGPYQSSITPEPSPTLRSPTPTITYSGRLPSPTAMNNPLDPNVSPGTDTLMAEIRSKLGNMQTHTDNASAASSDTPEPSVDY